MTLATISESGDAHSAAVYVYLTPDLTCYFVTKTATDKFKNIKKNAKATLSTYDENFLMFGELVGEAQQLESEEEVNTIILELQKVFESRKSSYWAPPVTQITGGEYVIIKVSPRQINYTNFEQSSSDNPHPHEINLTL